jgi:hypothetical protein
MILAKKKDTETLLVVMGFVGVEGGPVRAVCVAPVGGQANAYYLHDLVFNPLVELPAPPHDNTWEFAVAERQKKKK